VCFMYVVGKCQQGDACKSKHPAADACKQILAKVRRTPCKTGLECKRRDCMFKHPTGREIID
jgi:hypothetical protein